MASVLGNKHGWRAARSVLASLLVLVLSLSLVGCGDRTPVRSSRPSKNDSAPLVGRVSEVSPPAVIQELGQDLEAYQPQLKILSPKANEVLKDQTVSVRLQLKDLPLYKDQNLGLGPHLHVILDNQPYKAVYSLDDALVFEDLEPGTHTIRAFASRPWHESFKNEGAYAQVTFHVLTKTPDNNPLSNQPLLTYSRPVGTYGAEPVMLDFYLINAPLHLIAQERSDDEIKDWRIRCTVNGESFIFDEWQPIYLKGLKPGKNWVQLELLDEDGKPIPNAFNNTVRIINYEPGGEDTLSRLVRGELLASAARGIVDPNYKPEPEPEPEPEPLPIPEVTPTPEPEAPPVPVVPTPEPEVSPSLPGVPVVPAPEVTPTPSPTLKQPATEEVEELPDAEELTQPSPAPSPTPKAVRQREAAKAGGWRDRFRKRSPEPPAAVEPPAEPVVPETTVEQPGDALEQEAAPPDVQPSPEPAPKVTPQPSPAVEDWRERIRRRYSEQAQPTLVTPSPVTASPAPSPQVTEPEEAEAPAAVEPEPEPAQAEEPEPDQPVQPEPAEAPVVKPLPPKATRTAPAPQKPAFDAKQFFERFRQSAGESAESVQQSVKSLIDRYSAPKSPVAPELAPPEVISPEVTPVPTEPIEVPSVLPPQGEPAEPVSPES